MAQVRVNQITLPSVQFARLSEDQARQIHWASLEILERLGVYLHHAPAVDLLKRAGADVSHEGGEVPVVRIPSGMVERAFNTVPRRVVLHDRHGRPTMPLEPGRCYYGPGSDCLNILDHRSGQRRKPLLSDVVEGARLCDALPDIDFLMSMVLPSDVNQTLADVYQMEAMLSNTTKPIIAVTYGLRGLEAAVAMAEVVAGGPEVLRRRPIVTCYINVVSGRNHNREALEKLIYLAEKGLPALYVPASTGGVTSPVTQAGAIALDNAGVLLGLVLSQLVREGAPYIMTGMQPGSMDMRTMVTPYAHPERGLFQAMAQYYGLPSFAYGGASDAKVVDQQAAAEAALTLLAESLGGGNIIHDLGYLESGLTFSFVQLVICHEMVGWVEAFLRGAEVSMETLALDVMEQAGPAGHFLDKEHTRQHHRMAWTPKLFERWDYKAWMRQGGTTLGERAAGLVEQLLSGHDPEPLPDKIRGALRAQVTRAVETTDGS